MNFLQDYQIGKFHRSSGIKAILYTWLWVVFCVYLYEKPEYSRIFLYTAVFLSIASVSLTFVLWTAYGRKSNSKPAVTPEFDPPNNLSPIEMGILSSYGSTRNRYIYSTLMGLVSKDFISIENMENSKDQVLILKNNSWSPLSAAEQEILDMIFILPEIGQITRLSQALATISKNIKYIEYNVNQKLIMDGIFSQQGLLIKRIVNILKIFLLMAMSAGIIILIMTSLFFSDSKTSSMSSDLVNEAIKYQIITTSFIQASAVLLCGFIILHILSKVIIHTTEKGSKLMARIKGFELYLTQAERYREQFFEKEGDFTRLLPYAMAFNLTGIWLQKINSIMPKNELYQFINSTSNISKRAESSIVPNLLFEISKIISEFRYTFT